MNSVETRARRITWYHPLELPTPSGTFLTRPQWHIRRRFARRMRLLQIPENLTGKRVLDVGTWDGFWAYECERRGASVLAIDTYAWDHHGMDGFLLAHEARHSKVEYKRLAVEDVSEGTVGAFDLILFLGVFYHLRSPIAVLDNLRRICRGTLILETHCLLPAVHEAYPLVSFFPGDGFESHRPKEFTAIPTIEALIQMLLSAGFRTVEIKHRPTWRFFKKLTALVTTRPQSGRVIIHAR
jgi:tRNA (mo5U34)-methyltransferase